MTTETSRMYHDFVEMNVAGENEMTDTKRAETINRGDADVAAVASLMADDARAAMLTALSDGWSLTAGELARAANVARSTASSHLTKLVDSGFLETEAWGRHRYFRVSGPEVVGAIEALSVLAPAKPTRSLRQSRAAGRVRFARTCYDHLAGYLGVRFTRALVSREILTEEEEGYGVTTEGLEFLREFGVDLSGRKGRTRFAPRHVDWSERYHHFAGPLAKATTERLFELGWITRVPDSRAIRLTETGGSGLEERFGLTLDDTSGTARSA